MGNLGGKQRSNIYFVQLPRQHKSMYINLYGLQGIESRKKNNNFSSSKFLDK